MNILTCGHLFLMYSYETIKLSIDIHCPLTSRQISFTAQTRESHYTFNDVVVIHSNIILFIAHFISLAGLF